MVGNLWTPVAIDRPGAGSFAAAWSIDLALLGLFAAGWLAVPVATLMIHHFGLFGIRQAWMHLQKQDAMPLPFKVRYADKHVRHPIYVAWAMAFWFTPTMTVGHLLLAAGMTIYMALAALVEERDLIAHLGSSCREYRSQVPMFVPQWRVAQAVTTEPSLGNLSIAASEALS